MQNSPRESIERQRQTLKATQLRKAREGIHPASLPVGYETCRYVTVPDKECAPLIAQAIRYAAEGWTLARIKQYLDKADFMNKSGKPASLGMVCDMVKNPFYAGYIRWNGKLYPGRHASLVPLNLVQEAERQMALRRKRKVGITNAALWDKTNKTR